MKRGFHYIKIIMSKFTGEKNLLPQNGDRLEQFCTETLNVEEVARFLQANKQKVLQTYTLQQMCPIFAQILRRKIAHAEKSAQGLYSQIAEKKVNLISICKTQPSEKVKALANICRVIKGAQQKTESDDCETIAGYIHTFLTPQFGGEAVRQALIVRAIMECKEGGVEGTLERIIAVFTAQEKYLADPSTNQTALTEWTTLQPLVESDSSLTRLYTARGPEAHEHAAAAGNNPPKSTADMVQKPNTLTLQRLPSYYASFFNVVLLGFILHLILSEQPEHARIGVTPDLVVTSLPPGQHFERCDLKNTTTVQTNCTNTSWLRYLEETNTTNITEVHKAAQFLESLNLKVVPARSNSSLTVEDSRQIRLLTKEIARLEKGTNLCSKHSELCVGNLGRNRDRMPQILDKSWEELKKNEPSRLCLEKSFSTRNNGDGWKKTNVLTEWLKQFGDTIRETKVDVRELRASQKEVDALKSYGIAVSYLRDQFPQLPNLSVLCAQKPQGQNQTEPNPIHVIDGHHRVFGYRVATGHRHQAKDRQISVRIIPQDAEKVLNEALQFPGVFAMDLLDNCVL